MDSLALSLARAGLIQFGRFVQPDGAIWPLAVHLRWLPSYPALLRDTAAALADLLPGLAADRLLTTADAIPIGTALALYSGLPMVYPYGDHRGAIEGAYDVGHPTVLLSDVLIDPGQAAALARQARQVGLEIRAVLAVLDLGRGAREPLHAAGYTVHCLLTVRDVLPLLEQDGLLPPAMRVAVERWLSFDGHPGTSARG